MVLVMFMLFGRRSTLLGKAGVLVFHMLVHACEYISRVVLYIALLGPLVSSTGRRSNFRIQRPLRLFVVVVFFSSLCATLLLVVVGSGYRKPDMSMLNLSSRYILPRALLAVRGANLDNKCRDLRHARL